MGCTRGAPGASQGAAACASLAAFADSKVRGIPAPGPLPRSSWPRGADGRALAFPATGSNLMAPLHFPERHRRRSHRRRSA
ncbi:exported hypothetical protein [Cupriavidus taiwanensis]|nr:exported hypothetical protein [Cupriavidus taiwanensis]